MRKCGLGDKCKLSFVRSKEYSLGVVANTIHLWDCGLSRSTVAPQTNLLSEPKLQATVGSMIHCTTTGEVTSQGQKLRTSTEWELTRYAHPRMWELHAKPALRSMQVGSDVTWSATQALDEAAMP